MNHKFIDDPKPSDVNADGVPFGKWLDWHCGYYERGYSPPYHGGDSAIERWNACQSAQEAAIEEMAIMDEEEPD